MTLLEEIKATQLLARKGNNQLMASLLTTLIGEAQSVGKNDGNRETTDLEVIAIVKKFIKNIDECLAVPSLSQEAGIKLVLEKKILSDYLPPQMSALELELTIQNIIAEIGASTKDMGKVMGLLKQRHDGLYDGKVSSTIVKNMLAG
jgi:uncharacterized protein YqeY